jgi:general stress protein 26
MATAASTSDDKKPARRIATKVSSAKASKPAAAKSATTSKPATKTTTKATASKSAIAKPAKAATGKTQTPKTSQAANRQSHDSSMTGKEHAEHVERVWELAKRIGIAMFVTWDGEQQRARPLAATIEKDEGAVYFLTDVNGEKDDQIAEFPHVSVSFADHKHSKYVALSGRAVVSNDRARIKELWSPFAKAWWDSPEDPAIRVIRMVPQDAELWDSPGRLVTTFSMLAAAVTGRSPRIGENAKVTL